MRRAVATTLLIMFFGNYAAATFPEVTLDRYIFDFDRPEFMGDYFSAATKLTYTEGFTPGVVTTTDMVGISFLPSEQIETILNADLQNGIPLNSQELTDLFPSTVPDPLQDISGKNSLTFQGDFENGFQEFAVHQRKFASVQQSEGDFVDAFTETESNIPFQVVAPTPEIAQLEAQLKIQFDSLVQNFDNAFVSEGIDVKLLDVTDPQNPTVMNEFGGFYSRFDIQQSASFIADGMDVSSIFTTTPGTVFDEVQLQYTFDVLLDPSKTYSLNVFSDASAGVQGAGFALIDSTNTLDVSMEIVTPNASFTLPGVAAVPEPSSFVMLSIGALLYVRRRTN